MDQLPAHGPATLPWWAGLVLAVVAVALLVVEFFAVRAWCEAKEHNRKTVDAQTIATLTRSNHDLRMDQIRLTSALARKVPAGAHRAEPDEEDEAEAQQCVNTAD